ncbi:hypothetical protein [Nakamurella alba]|uniref:hypothetical protein n=1 Tax=Nakamurella alba TaxID=2665158 RepID=UPI0025463ACD|nr:hypothetical protein [Nakamurella alba]
MSITSAAMPRILASFSRRSPAARSAGRSGEIGAGGGVDVVVPEAVAAARPVPVLVPVMVWELLQ